MLKVRKHIGAKALALLTGILFLNMSFFLTEIRLLGLHVSHTQMIENVVKALAGVGFEEEKDSMGESETLECGDVVDLHIQTHSLYKIDVLCIATGRYGRNHNLEVLSSEAEITTPPPKKS